MAGPATALAAGTPSLTLSRQASDMLFLTRSQERRAWNDLHRQAVNQYLPPGFSASVEWALPNTVRIEPVTNKAGRDVPALRPYYFAIVQRKLLIVNPSDRIIAEVIRHWRKISVWRPTLLRLLHCDRFCLVVAIECVRALRG